MRTFATRHQHDEPFDNPLQDRVLVRAEKFLRPVAGRVASGLDRQFHLVNVIGQTELMIFRP